MSDRSRPFRLAGELGEPERSFGSLERALGVALVRAFGRGPGHHQIIEDVETHTRYLVDRIEGFRVVVKAT